MSALVMSNEVDRYNEGERVVARFGLFFSFFIWPLTYLGLYLVVKMGSMVMDDAPLSLEYLVIFASILALIWYARRHLRHLRMLDTCLDTWYAADSPEQVVSAQQVLSQAQGKTLEELSGPERLVVLAQRILVAAPLCSARALHARRHAMEWDADELARAQKVFEGLGAKGDAWSLCTSDASLLLLMPGLERLALIEHRIEKAQKEVRLRPEIRRRYFTKDPAQAAYIAPTRRR